MKVILFGTGLMYELYKKCFSFFEIVALADNDKRKQNSFIDGIKVIAPEEIINMDYERVFVLIAMVNLSEMKKQLIQIGVKPDDISTVYDIRRYCNGVDKARSLIIYTNDYNKIVASKKQRVAIFHPVRGLGINGVDTCLIQLCKILPSFFEVDVIISQDCNLKEKLLEYGVTVIIDEFSHIKRLDDYYWKENYDIIFLNSVDMFNILDGIKGEVSIPIVWWLHTIGEAVSQVPLERLVMISHKNINVFAVSPLTKETFQRALPDWEVSNLLYGLEEKANDILPRKNMRNKAIFAIVGRCSMGKGHDILVDAIKLLPDTIKSKCEIWFVGYMNPDRLFEKSLVEKIKSEECIKILGALYEDDLEEMYRNIDVLVCPSRADAMPIVCAEAMMHHHPCIVSENVGTKYYLEDKKSGLICKTGDAGDLCSKIQWCVMNMDKLLEMGDRAYNIYLNNFTMKKFETNVLDIIKDKVSNEV